MCPRSPCRRGLRLRLAGWGLAAALGLPVAGALAQPAPPGPRIGDVDVELLLRRATSRADDQTLRLLSALEREAPEGSERQIEAIYARATLNAMAARADAAEPLVRRLEARARETGDWRAESAATSLRGEMAAARGELEAAEDLARRGLDRLPADAPVLHRLRHAALLGFVLFGRGKFDEALAINLQAVALADASGVADRRAVLRMQLSFIYTSLKQPERAMAQVQEAIRIAQADGTVSDMTHAVLFNTLGASQEGNPAAQQAAYRRALPHARRSDNGEAMATVLTNLASTSQALGDDAAGLAYAQEALVIARRIGNGVIEADALLRLGIGRLRQRDIAAGKRHIAEARALARKLDQNVWIEENTPVAAAEFEKVGELAAAAEAYHEQREMADRILQLDRRKAILAIEESFAAQRRDAQLRVLRAESEQQSEQLRRRGRQQRLVGLLAGIGVAALLAISWLLWRVHQGNRALAQTNRDLRHQGEHDPLTGLGNRRFLKARLPAFTDPDGDWFRGTLCLVDIDHFKRVNDRHGHDAGDAVLVEVARRLAAVVRSDDVVVRWGGEEFVIALAGGDASRVTALVERVLQAIAGAPVMHGGLSIAVSASAGFASFPLAGSPPVSWERAVALADAALYHAKAQGRRRAFGVTALQADTPAQVDAAARAIAAACKAGTAQLVELLTPASIARDDDMAVAA